MFNAAPFGVCTWPTRSDTIAAEFGSNGALADNAAFHGPAAVNGTTEPALAELAAAAVIFVAVVDAALAGAVVDALVDVVAGLAVVAGLVVVVVAGLVDVDVVVVVLTAGVVTVAATAALAAATFTGRPAWPLTWWRRA